MCVCVCVCVCVHNIYMLFTNICIYIYICIQILLPKIQHSLNYKLLLKTTET